MLGLGSWGAWLILLPRWLIQKPKPPNCSREWFGQCSIKFQLQSVSPLRAQTRGDNDLKHMAGDKIGFRKPAVILCFQHGEACRFLAGSLCKCHSSKEKSFPDGGIAALKGRFPQWKCYSSALKRKMSWQLGAKDYHKTTRPNKPHTRFIGKDTKLAFSARARISRELGRGQPYIGFGRGVFQGRDF